jgi:hypothetical protein
MGVDDNISDTKEEEATAEEEEVMGNEAGAAEVEAPRMVKVMSIVSSFIHGIEPKVSLS